MGIIIPMKPTKQVTWKPEIWFHKQKMVWFFHAFPKSLRRPCAWQDSWLSLRNTSILKEGTWLRLIKTKKRFKKKQHIPVNWSILKPQTPNFRTQWTPVEQGTTGDIVLHNVGGTWSTAQTTRMFWHVNQPYEATEVPVLEPSNRMPFDQRTKSGSSVGFWGPLPPPARQPTVVWLALWMNTFILILYPSNGGIAKTKHYKYTFWWFWESQSRHFYL